MLALSELYFVNSIIARWSLEGFAGESRRMFPTDFRLVRCCSISVWRGFRFSDARYFLFLIRGLRFFTLLLLPLVSFHDIYSIEEYNKFLLDVSKHFIEALGCS